MTSAKRTSSKLAKGEPTPVATRTTVDLSKLRKTSLKRYKKHFELDCKAESKNDLLEAVMRHFASMPVREADVALEFHNFARSVRGRRTLAGESPATAPPPVAASTSVPRPETANGR